MASHEFGIMESKPKDKERFDEYDSYKYNFIKIDDDFIEPILIDLQSIDCYWHTLEVKEEGLAYCGITLIPPEAMNKLYNILKAQGKLEYIELIDLVKKAAKEDKYIIHFGL